jgi:hypothetical protein
MEKVQQDISKDALAEFKNWVESGAFLLHRFFELRGLIEESYIEKIFLKPKAFVNIDGKVDDRFVSIGVCKMGTNICVSVSNEIGKGKVFCYQLQTISERYLHDQDGDIIDFLQDDVYGFNKLSDSFCEFLDKDLYTNMCFDGVEELEPVKYN